MKTFNSLLLAISFHGLGTVSSAIAQTEVEPFAPAFPVVILPTISFAAGELRYQEHDSELVPGLKSHFEEPAFDTGIGIEFIFEGYHGLTLDFDFLQTDSGTERWRDTGVLIQENDLELSRFNFSIGYRASTWNRARLPSLLPEWQKIIRFDGGIAAYYRRQRFLRDDFFDFEQTPPTFIGGEVEETFDMVGAEFTLELELGPRHLAAAFIRGRAGGGYASVMNDSLEPEVSKNDFQFDTASVQGTVEAGVVSQFAPFIELRLGYRFLHQELFDQRITVFSQGANRRFEFPESSTITHMIFFEAGFPF